ncbi:MAG: ABC transporter ATP-binding protein, partial [Anaerolineae bacterium]|nr:ABC transporter ATP-binding protein [Anaerolineae bacterium]
MAMMKGERAHDFKGTMLKLFNYLGKYRVSLIIALFIAATSTVATIFGPKVMARAIDELVSGVMAMSSGTGSIDFVAIG